MCLRSLAYPILSERLMCFADWKAAQPEAGKKKVIEMTKEKKNERIQIKTDDHVVKFLPY